MNIKKDFPFFEYNPDCIYFDSAATTQKPESVIEAESSWYTNYNANAKRGIYPLAEQTTTLLENTRTTLAHFLGAPNPQSLVFTSGTTASINLVAHAWAAHTLQEGDEIILSILEHHANFIPWQQLALKKNLKLTLIPLTPEGDLDYVFFQKAVSGKTKLVAITHVSNALGIKIDIKLIVKAAHVVGAKVLVDGAQAVGYLPVNLTELQVDFYTSSAHKMLGPTGIGFLYVHPQLHKEIKPCLFGGGAVESVTQAETLFAPFPYCLEPGTLPLAQIYAFHAALTYLSNLGLEVISDYLAALTTYAVTHLEQHPNVRILGPLESLKQHAHLFSFVHTSMHAHDLAAYLAQHGICVRAGNHCAQPLSNFLNISSSIRVSFHIYNTLQDIDILIKALNKLQ